MRDDQPASEPTRERMRVLFIVPSLRRAGAERQVVDLVNALPDNRIEKHLLCYRPNMALSEDLNCESVRLHAYVRRGRFDWQLVKRISRLIDDHQIDIVHCTLQNALLYGSLAVMFSKRTSVPIIAAIHTTLNVDWKYELSDRLLYQWFLRRCSEIWFVCDSQRRHWTQKYRFLAGRSFTIFNGVDSNKYRPADPNTGLGSRVNASEYESIVSCIAGFRPEKGHDILLQAFADVLKDHPETRLLLAGDGPTRAKCEALAASLGIRDKVEFLGQISDVRAIVLRSDCTVLASTSVETFSIAMLESMAMGVPVVATDIGGAAEAIDQGDNGFLVPPGESQALAEALARIVSDRCHALRLGVRARRTIVSRFELGKMAAEAELRMFGLAKCGTGPLAVGT